MSTIYLDTANWIDLAKDNYSSAEFEAAVSAGKLEPVLSFAHLLDLAKQRQDGWRGVSEYIDGIRNKGTTHWVLPLDDIKRVEVEAAFAQFLRIEIPRIQPFTNSLVEALPNSPNDPITEKSKTESVQKQIERLHDHPAYVKEYLSERNNVFPELRKNALRDPKKLTLYYAPKSLPSSGLLIDEPTRREFAEKIDIMNLPAFSMAVAYNQGMSHIESYRPSDYEDYLHISGLAYCDVGFADSGMCEALKQGRSRIYPTRNGKFEQWLATLHSIRTIWEPIFS